MRKPVSSRLAEGAGSRVTHVGRVCEIVRYPIKSMAGVPTDAAMLGWHGLEGDRRYAFRRVGDNSGFPWLSASRLPGSYYTIRSRPTVAVRSHCRPMFGRETDRASRWGARN